MLTQASTSPFLATDSMSSISRKHKVRIRNSAKRYRKCISDRQRKMTSRQQNKAESTNQTGSTSPTKQNVDRRSTEIKQISASYKNSAEECRKMLKIMRWILRQNWIEKVWQQRILQQIGIQIDQSEDEKILQSASEKIKDSKLAKTPHVRGLKGKKSTGVSTRSARQLRSSLGSAPGLPGHYKKPKRQLFNPILFQNVEQDTSTETKASSKNISTSATLKSSFQNSTNSSFQNYVQHLPSVRMARTKQTARKNRDDRHRDDERQQGQDDRREGSDDSPLRRRRRASRSPLPTEYVCVFCRKVNHQRTNHRRHLIMLHSCRIDGTPATEADLRQARAWSSSQPKGRSARYKSREFVTRHRLHQERRRRHVMNRPHHPEVAVRNA